MWHGALFARPPVPRPVSKGLSLIRVKRATTCRLISGNTHFGRSLQPAIHRCFANFSSLVEECSTSNWNKPLPADGRNKSVSVALGKFDGMHQGHRLLAQQAASCGATPYLLSFSGMAEVLGWPARLPLVAACDRSRVLTSWTPHCQGNTPRQRYIPFAMVRNLSPEEFVQTLVNDLQVAGIVVGQNYRFG